MSYNWHALSAYTHVILQDWKRSVSPLSEFCPIVEVSRAWTSCAVLCRAVAHSPSTRQNACAACPRTLLRVSPGNPPQIPEVSQVAGGSAHFKSIWHSFPPPQAAGILTEEWPSTCRTNAPSNSPWPEGMVGSTRIRFLLTADCDRVGAANFNGIFLSRGLLLHFYVCKRKYKNS
jgi:hypothetical protein